MRAYINSGMEAGDYPASQVVVGWTIGIALTGFDNDGDEIDGFIYEKAAGVHSVMARGIADQAAEMFAAEGPTRVVKDEE